MFFILVILFALVSGQLELVQNWTATTGRTIRRSYFEGLTNEVVIFERDPSQAKVFLWNSSVPLSASQFSIGAPFSDASAIAGTGETSNPFYRLYYRNNTIAATFSYSIAFITSFVTPFDEIVARVNYNLTDNQRIDSVIGFKLSSNKIVDYVLFPIEYCPNSLYFRKAFSLINREGCCVNGRNLTIFHVQNYTVNVSQILTFQNNVFAQAVAMSKNGQTLAAGFHSENKVYLFWKVNDVWINHFNITELVPNFGGWVELSDDGDNLFVLQSLSTTPLPLHLWWYHFNGASWNLFDQIETGGVFDPILSNDNSMLTFRDFQNVFLYRINYPQPTTQVSSTSHGTLAVSTLADSTAAEASFSPAMSQQMF